MSEQLQADVQIGSIEFPYLSRVIVKNVVYLDPQQRAIARLPRLAVSIDIIALLSQKLHINNAQLIGGEIHLAKDSLHSPLNIQPLLDAINSMPKSESSMTIELGQLMIRRTSIFYDIASQERVEHQLDPHHIGVTNMILKMSLHQPSRDSINLNIKRLSFNEQSGMSVKKLSAHITANSKQLDVTNFQLNLPATELKLERMRLSYNSYDDFGDFANKVRLDIAMHLPIIRLKDFSPIVPALRNFNDNLSLSAQLKGSINHLQISGIKSHYGDDFDLLGHLSFSDLTDRENAIINGRLNYLQLSSKTIESLMANFSGSYKRLPPEIARLGTIRFSGNINGYFDNLIVDGRLKSSIGELRTDILLGLNPTNRNFEFSGSLIANNLKIGLLTPNSTFDNLSLNIKAKGRIPRSGHIEAEIDGEVGTLDIKGYPLQKITLKGAVGAKGFDGHIMLNDPNINMALNGWLDLTDPNAKIGVNGYVRGLKLDKLGLAPEFPDSDLSLKVDANIVGSSIDKFNGFITVDSLRFDTQRGLLQVDDFVVSAENNEQNSYLSIHSDIIEAEVLGSYSFINLPKDINQMMSRYLPSLFHYPVDFIDLPDNQFTFNINLYKSTYLSYILNLPVALDEDAFIQGEINERYDMMHFTADAPAIFIGKTTLYNNRVSCETRNGKLSLQVASNIPSGKRDTIDLSLTAHILDDSIATQTQWSNRLAHLYAGEFLADIKLHRGNHSILDNLIEAKSISQELSSEIINHKLNADLYIRPSKVILNDSLWHVRNSSITIHSGRIGVDNFLFENNNHALSINGNASPLESDTLNIGLREVDLAYLFTIIPLEGVTLAGAATGEVYASSLLTSPILNADLTVRDVIFNSAEMGQVDVLAEWIPTQQVLGIVGQITSKQKHITPVNGAIFFQRDSLSIHFGANHANLQLLRPWLNGILTDIEGQGSGDFHLFGNFELLQIEGNVMAENTRFKIDFLNTYYRISDTIRVTPTSININHIVAQDDEGNTAIISGKVKHKYFLDMEYNINIETSRLLALNTTAIHNDLFYGKVYGKGLINIAGGGSQTRLTANVRAEKGSKFNFVIGGQTTASEIGFIKYINPNAPTLAATRDKSLLDSIQLIRLKRAELSLAPENRMLVNLNLEVAPEMEMNMIMDPKSDDKIAVTGQGNLRIDYDSNDDVKMFGNYTIDQGKYLFTVQEVIRKDFVITPGSTVRFTGDPMMAELGIKARYNLVASLNDLLEESSLADVKRTSVTVSCLLNVTGPLVKPQIVFDIDLPSSDEDLKRKVRNVVNSEDQISRQIVYLLMIGKFYTPDYMRGQTSTSGTSDLTAFASTTLSSQLNNMIAKIDNSWNINTNIRSNDNFTDYELGLALSKQLLNNRLTIDGSLVYKNSQTTSTNFLGDIDVEYKLTRDGKFRIKAYNHTNDRYYYKSSLMTQGVGLVYTEEFSNLKELFNIQKSDSIRKIKLKGIGQQR